MFEVIKMEPQAAFLQREELEASFALLFASPMTKTAHAIFLCPGFYLHNREEKNMSLDPAKTKNPYSFLKAVKKEYGKSINPCAMDTGIYSRKK